MNCYGVMIKYPEPGKVKTRLAEGIGEEEAASIFRDLSERLLQRTAPRADEYFRFVLYDPPGRSTDFISWLPGERFIPQRGGDIGERMHNAITDLLDYGAGKAVITGSDIPGLDRELITHAFEGLERADVVLGPAKDGGYYLIGMKAPAPELFSDIPWSTADVLSYTVRKVSQAGKSLLLLPELSDIDTIEDLKTSVSRGTAP